MKNKSQLVYKIIRYFSLFCFFSISPIVCTQESNTIQTRNADLNNTTPSWTAVQGGKATADFVPVSYGFIIPNDGRIIYGYSESGNLYWLNSIKGRPGPYITSHKDLTLAITDDDTINFLNSNGKTVWTQKAGFKIKENPLVGRDFRIFIKGSSKISCYGTMGIRKWIIDTPELSSLPLCELNDGSLLAFTVNDKDSKTQGIRISAFGEILETITFAGKVISASNCPEGVALLFLSDSCGLCSVKEKNAISSWVNNSISTTSNQSKIISDINTEYAAIICSKGTQSAVYYLDTEKGTIISSFTISDINPQEITHFAFSEAGLFISDKKNATEYTYDGQQIWTCKLPPSSKWNYITYSKSNYILISMNNWVINAWRMNQHITGNIKKPVQKTVKYTENKTSSQELDSIGIRTFTNEELIEIASKLKNGDFGQDEEEWLTKLTTEFNNYITSLSAQKKSVRDTTFFEDNQIYTQNLLTAVSLTGTDFFADDFAYALLNEKNPGISTHLIYCAGVYGQDPKGEILKTFEEITKHDIQKRDITKAKILCDATFNICRTMGKPFLLRYGKNSLNYLLRPQFDNKIKDYSRKTLTKVIELEL